MVDFINKIFEVIKDMGAFLIESESIMSLLGVVIGWKLNEHSLEKSERRKEKQKRFENKPELYIEKEDKDTEVNLEVFIGPFNIKYDENKKYEIVFPKSIKNKKHHEYKDIVLKNIGKTDIDCLHIVSSDKRGTILLEYSSLNTFIKKKAVCYCAWYDKKIRVGETIKIRIYYLKNNMPILPFSSTLAFIFEDQNRDIWEQPYFYERDNVYAPYLITYNDMVKKINTDDAYDCFKNPRLW